MSEKREDKPLFKLLVDGVSCNGGDYKYDLPKFVNGKWKPGKWTKRIAKAKLSMCSVGYHLTTDPLQWLRKGCKIYLAEAKDIVEWSDDKCLCAQVRLLQEFETNTGKDNTGVYNSGYSNSGYSNSGDRNSGYSNSGYSNSGDRNSGDRNSGYSNSGDRNSGYSNSGDSNSGDSNSGYSNSGDSNSGYRNSGDSNSGYSNSGDRNSGYRNSGDSNSGYRNSGYSNSGYSNSGDRNSGYSNSGDSNSGYSNSGSWNAGNLHTGAFNTDTPKKMYLFNKLIPYAKYKRISFPDYFYFNLTEWIWYTEEEMKDDKHKTATQGYLKTYKYKDAWRRSFKKASVDEIKQTTLLPHFNYATFTEITGITKKMIQKRLKEK